MSVFALVTDSGSIDVALEYSTDLYTRKTADSVLHAYAKLLSAVAQLGDAVRVTDVLGLGRSTLATMPNGVDGGVDPMYVAPRATPRNDAEVKLMEVWAQCLGLQVDEFGKISHHPSCMYYVHGKPQV
jgi:hypothetical protein